MLPRRVFGKLLVLTLLAAATATWPDRGARAETGANHSDSLEVSQLLREIVLVHLPNEYENTKQWGGTKEIWDGLHVSLDGFQIKTKRRKKLANHGTWKRYKAWLINPDHNLRMRVMNVGTTDDDRAAFDLVVQSKLGAFGRLSEWNRDIQLVSVSVNAEADLTLLMRCEMGLSFDFEHLPPDLRIDPIVRDAKLTLDRFRLQRISDLHGPLVRELGKSLETVLQKELDRRRNKLVLKLNRQIEKRRDRLRFSIRELLNSERLPLLDSLGGIPIQHPKALVGHGDRGDP